jgi:hypothetical protein
MDSRHEDEFVRAATIENIIESQILEAVLTERGMPHQIRSYHDTAYDGLFQMQKGWGEVRTPAACREEVIEILGDIRAAAPASEISDIDRAEEDPL